MYESTVEQYVGKMPEGLEVGSEVTYSPSGEYNWQAKYCSTTQTEDVTLSSESGKDFNLTEWKVLSIENGKVEMVPTEPTKGTVYLGEAQGYNNGVKLLNDACSNLYSSKGVNARSLNIDDIEKYMDSEKVKEIQEYQYDSTTAKYGMQLDSAYTTNKKYPIIYAREFLNVINEVEQKDGLKGNEQTEFIEKIENEANEGSITQVESIHPYQSYWHKESTYMKEAFKKATNGTDYYDLLIKPSKKYWLSSRCIATYSSNCGFYINYVYNGSVGAGDMYGSDGNVNSSCIALFPILSLNASSITGDTTNGFTVKVN